MESGIPGEYCSVGDDSGCATSDWRVPAHEARFWLGRQSYWAVLVPVLDERDRVSGLLTSLARLARTGLADVVLVSTAGAAESFNPVALQAAGIRGLLELNEVAGLSAGLRCGYSFLMGQGYDGVISIEGSGIADLQRIQQFIDALEDGFDFVQGSHFIVDGAPDRAWPRRVWRGGAVKRLAAAALSLSSGFRWTDYAQGTRAYSRRLLLDPRIAVFRDAFCGDELPAYLSHRVPRLGFNCVELPTEPVAPAAPMNPSLISAIHGNIRLLRILAKVCAGRLDPPPG